MSIETNLNKHLDEEELHFFLDNPQSSKVLKQRQHLAMCVECRHNASMLQAAQEFVSANVETLSQASRHSALKSKLHQLTHEFAMNDMATEKTEVNKTLDKKGIVYQLVNSIRAGLKENSNLFALPATAIAAFFSAYLLIGQPPQISDEIIEFQDSPTLVITEVASKPGLGFFHEAEKEESLIDYSGFNVTSDKTGKYVQITWPKISGASRYDVTLYEISNNVRQQLDKISTNKTLWLVNKSAMRSGVLYRLTLTGKTGDNFRFRHTGGFVLRD